MVGYRFYWHHPIKGYDISGILPERRKSPERIMKESVINWARKIIGENVDANNIFFIRMTLDKDSGEIAQERY